MAKTYEITGYVRKKEKYHKENNLRGELQVYDFTIVIFKSVQPKFYLRNKYSWTDNKRKRVNAYEFYQKYISISDEGEPKKYFPKHIEKILKENATVDAI